MRSLARRTMATWVFLANDGSDRLIVSTIRTRLVFFTRRVSSSAQSAGWRGDLWVEAHDGRGFDWVRSWRRRAAPQRAMPVQQGAGSRSSARRRSRRRVISG